MVKRERLVVASAGAVVALAALYALLRAQSPAVSGAGGRPEAPVGEGGRGDLPRIALDRAHARPPRPDLGDRDIFGYATPPPPPPPPPTLAPVATPPPVTVPTPTPLPPLNVKYIGSMEQKGKKVALFMSEQKEVMSGQVGQTVMNRFRVVRIGFESVDVEEVGSGQVRRIPLRGN
jgi:hypothetical protein